MNRNGRHTTRTFIVVIAKKTRSNDTDVLQTGTRVIGTGVVWTLGTE